MEKTDYRKRFFKRYITNQVEYVEKISPKSFDIVARGFRKHISRFLPDGKSASILDIACGAGHLLHFLQNQGYYKAQGIDLGAEQLKIARKMGVKNIEQADLFEYLEKYKDYFDLIIAFQLIEHLKKDEAVKSLDLIYRALKPGGKVLVTTPNAVSLGGLWISFGDFTHELVFTPRSLSQLLRVCRFSNVEVYGQGPVTYDFRSGIRTILWKFLKTILRFCFMIERGTGRSIWEAKPIFEGSILGVGWKLEKNEHI
ncbi:class I SAM-dependent methyltransferase [Candidatus Aerophobetes bacterium]|nr:class I SAM-dependent methyltransferase [Candidatus Aerophobetes bacterium]